jgi:hypothetical protein
LCILFIGERDFADHRPGRWIDEFKYFSAVGFDESAVDIDMVYRFHGISVDG